MHLFGRLGGTGAVSDVSQHDSTRAEALPRAQVYITILDLTEYFAPGSNKTSLDFFSVRRAWERLDGEGHDAMTLPRVAALSRPQQVARAAVSVAVRAQAYVVVISLMFGDMVSARTRPLALPEPWPKSHPTRSSNLTRDVLQAGGAPAMTGAQSCMCAVRAAARDSGASRLDACVLACAVQIRSTLLGALLLLVQQPFDIGEELVIEDTGSWR